MKAIFAKRVSAKQEDLVTLRTYNDVCQALVEGIEKADFPAEVRDHILHIAAEKFAHNTRPGGETPTVLASEIILAPTARLPETVRDMADALTQTKDLVMFAVGKGVYAKYKFPDNPYVRKQLSDAFDAAETALAGNTKRSR